MDASTHTLLPEVGHGLGVEVKYVAKDHLKHGIEMLIFLCLKQRLMLCENLKLLSHVLVMIEKSVEGFDMIPGDLQ